MAEYRNGERARVDRRGGAGKTIAVIVVIALLVIAALFLTGFWRLNASGEFKAPQVTVKGGELPNVDLDSKRIVVGTKQTTVDVPKVETEKKKIDVPVVGATEGKKD